jgi:hypothetical protein
MSNTKKAEQRENETHSGPKANEKLVILKIPVMVSAHQQGITFMLRRRFGASWCPS